MVVRLVPPDENSIGLLRTPPSNVEVERALLGALLINNRSFDHVSDFLLPEHFTDAVNGRIYAAFSALIAKNQQVSAITLKTYLERDVTLIEAGGFKYLTGLSSGMVTIINAADYGRMIYDLHLRRELIVLGEDIVNNAFDSRVDESASDQIEEAAGRLSSLTSTKTDSHALTLSEAVTKVMTRWQKHDNGEIAGLSTGLLDLDREMGLLENGDLLIIAGPPASGKTALSFTLAYNAAKAFREANYGLETKPLRAVVFSAEMSAEELASRAMTTYTGLQGPRRRHTSLDGADWGRITDFAQDIAGMPLVIDDRGAPSLAYIRSRCRQEQRKGGVGLVVVDYLQIMGSDPGRRYDGRTDEVSRMIRGLKELARTMNCPVICLSQLKRGVEQRDNKRPTLSDLRDSGEIEAAADIVAFCYREEYYLEMNEPDLGKDHDLWEMKMAKCKGTAEVIIAKARHGSTGTARLYFDRTRTLFSDLAQQSNSREPTGDWRLL